MSPSYTHGPYTVIIALNGFRLEGRDGARIGATYTHEDADRIAYCLTVVEQSEETARRDEGAVGDNDRLRIGASSIGDQRTENADLVTFLRGAATAFVEDGTYRPRLNQAADQIERASTEELRLLRVIEALVVDRADMLAALKKLIAWEDNSPVPSPADHYKRTIDAARAAIARVEARP